MITVEDARAIAAGRAPLPDKPAPTLTDASVTAFDQFDYGLETIVVREFRNGEILSTSIPAEMVPLDVIESIKIKWEKGGWAFGIIPIEDADGLVRKIILVLAPADSPQAVATTLPEFKPTWKGKLTMPQAPTVVPAPVLAAPGDLRLLLRMPTRSRPEQALQVLQRYRDMAGMPVQIEVVIDHDDSSMLSGVVLQRLAELDCVVTVGLHRSKIEACNSGRLREWDILALISDDMVPVVAGYARRITQAMMERWPHLDGALHFNDGHKGSSLCTLPIFGRRLYGQFGYIYEPEYLSLFCDDEQTTVLKEMGRLSYVDEVIIEHRHPAHGGHGTMDALYRKNETFWGADEDTAKRRRATVRPHAQWGFDSPPLWLTIGILTVPSRRKMLDRLLDDLYTQIVRDCPRQVEIVVENGNGTRGAKRQRVLDRARGRFVCFVDDDDGVCNSYTGYVAHMVSAIEGEPDADCVSLIGEMTTDGAQPERFEHSIKYAEWSTVDGTHFRCPNHLNPIRTSIARSVGFSSSDFGEDQEYSLNLRGKLKSEASTGETILYYYRYRSAK